MINALLTTARLLAFGDGRGETRPPPRSASLLLEHCGALHYGCGESGINVFTKSVPRNPPSGTAGGAFARPDAQPLTPTNLPARIQAIEPVPHKTAKASTPDQMPPRRP